MQYAGGIAADAIGVPAADDAPARREPLFGKTYQLLALIVLVHFAVALVMSDRPLANYVDRTWLSDVVPFFVLPALAWIAGLTFVFARRGAKSPLAALRRVIYFNRHRLLRSAVLLALYVVTSRAYRAIKVALPRYADFSLDPSWAALDRAIFGADAWRLTHALIGPGGTWVIDRVYILWLPVMVSMFAWIAFTSDRAFQLRAAFTYFLIWILLGNALALALSSAGPCYYEVFVGDATFRPLMDRLEAIGNLHALPLQNYLLAASGVESIGSGISAMPSVHVAMTTLLVLMVRERFGWRWPTWLAAAYHLAILVGSVHLGWHYAVDGLVSMGLVPILWFAIGRLLRSPRAAR